MKRRILRNTLLIVAVTALVFTAVVVWGLLNFFTAQTTRELDRNLSQIGIALTREDDREGYLQAVADSGFTERLTLIAADGTVLYDSQSDIAQMENHLQREEIQEALVDEYGSSVRYSDTLREQTYYYAERLPDGSFIRLSDTRSSIFGMLLSLTGYFLIALAFVCTAVGLLATQMTRRLVAPINSLNLDVPEENTVYPELQPLLERMAHQNRSIQEYIRTLNARRIEFDTITAGMAEGLVMMNTRGDVLFINRSAERFFKTEGAEGKNILSLTNEPIFTETLRLAMRDRHCENTVESEGRYYQLHINPVHDSGHFTGMVALIPDITDQYLAERNRREFTANVSHELKTPLTSIVGCAEIMKTGIAAEKDWQALVECIYKEGSRMIHLVEDILYLSKLDSGAVYAERETLELKQLAQEIATRFETAAKKKNVRIEVVGEPVEIKGARQMTDEMISNLVDNAVKYNRENGVVTIETGRETDCAILRVRDTGIGIALSDQPRVFERFFRVDKSRSKATGGTGLGLSIVKHAVSLLNARIRLYSRPGEGTTITIRIPFSPVCAPTDADEAV